jgi:Asp-tRNA(Asn)/Glu-tRNA(Gln) amidotransferase A subunit family amidase
MLASTFLRSTRPGRSFSSVCRFPKPRIMDSQWLEAAGAVKAAGINFVGIDFDVSTRYVAEFCGRSLSRGYLHLQQTFISRHTGGRWQGSAEDLALFTRAEFKNLVSALLDNGKFVNHRALEIS